MFLLYITCVNNNFYISGNGQFLSNNCITVLPCNISRKSNENIDSLHLERKLLYEFRMKEFSERLEQITMFNTRCQKKKY